MNLINLRLAGIAAIIGGAVVALSTSPSLAQPDTATSSPPTPTEAVTVFAPRVERHVSTGAARFPGAPVEVLTVSHIVSFADLDLATQAGSDEFLRRIYFGALAACDEMEAEYPSNIYVPVSADQNCPDNAVRAALVQADEIIAAAKRNH